MKLKNNLSIKVKLLAGFTLVALIAGLIGVIGILQMETMNQRDQELYALNTVPISLISDVSTSYQRMRISIRDIVLFSSNSKRQKKNSAYVKELDDTIQQLFIKFETRLTTKDIRDEFKILKNTFANYKPARNKLIELAMINDAHNRKKALFLLKREGSSVAMAIDNSITKLKDLEVAQAEIKSEANSSTAISARKFTISMSVIGVLLAIAMGVLLSRLINRPLREAIDLTHAVAHGDFTQQLNLNRKDEIGDLSSSLNDMCTTLAQMIAVTMKATDELAQSAETQAASIEETSAAVTDIDGRTGEIAKRANETDSLMQHSLEMIGKVQTCMDGLTKAINTSEEASRETLKIVKVIDGIAFQVKLLSLNASVEAARAGEYGTGFAVVAEEMRNLAIRTADAANESTEHINKATAQIKEGSHLAKELDKSFSEASQDASNSGVLASEISNVLKDQAEGTRQISATLIQMGDSIQHHAQICNDLVENMSSFQINRTDCIDNEAAQADTDNSNPSVMIAEV